MATRQSPPRSRAAAMLWMFAVGHRRHARAEELVLRVGRHDARGTLAIEFDLAGARQDVERALDRFRVQVVAQVEQGIDRAAADFIHQVGRQVVLRRLLVRARHGQGQALGQLQLEFMPAVVAQGAAKAHHGRFRHLRAFRQRRDVLADRLVGLV
jgi:hypothetical protein